MLFPQTHTLLLALAAVPSVLAHTSWDRFFDGNGHSEAPGYGIRLAALDGGKHAVDPVHPWDDDITCGFAGTTGAKRVVAVDDGATVSFQFQNSPWNNQGLYPVDHKGPCAVYMKKVDSALTDTGKGDGWFKITEDGYHADTNEWCNQRLIKNGGFYSFQLPSGLLGGDYLVRPELLAMHNNDKGDPQFYTTCAQIHLKSKGNLVPKSTVSIPGYIKATDPGVTFNLWSPDQSPARWSTYEMPGPAVATLIAGPSGASAETAQTEGLKPANCLLEYGGTWCGVEVPSYSDESGCWAAQTNCYNQGEKCWALSLPIPNTACSLWEDYCKSIQDECKAKNFKGPTNAGKSLTPSNNANFTSTFHPKLVYDSAVGGDTGETPASSSAVAAAASGQSSAVFVSPVVAASPTSSPTVAAYTNVPTMITKVKPVSSPIGSPAPTANSHIKWIHVTETKIETVYKTVTVMA